MAAEETTKRLREIMLDGSGDWPDYKVDQVNAWTHVQPGRELGLVVWKFRKIALDRLGHDFREELDLMRLSAKVAKVKCISMWKHRFHLVKRLGIEAIKEELNFTKNILAHDDLNNEHGWAQMNKHAWRHRRDLVKKLKIDVSKELEFSAKIIGKDAKNDFAWSQRQWLVQREPHAARDELGFTKDIILCVDTKNHYAWSYRRWIYEKLKLFRIDDDGQELRLTGEILYVDARNEYAWYHRKWFIKAFGRWEYEISFCNEIIAKNVHNEHAWAQRLLVFTSCDQEMPRDEEVSYALRAIVKEPSNERPWNYLRGIYQHYNSYDSLISPAFENVLLILHNRAKDGLMDIISNIVLDEEIYVNALVTILDLIYLGYCPSQGIRVVIANLRATLVNNNATNVVYADIVKSVISRVVNDISTILQYVDSTDKHDWKWRMEMVRYKS
ncbi:protein farnesyltransferase/ geranylgeranyltransferase type-1 subunit alpha [Phtheirospermum japonicum]|uniref:Protein farnesyltransferase/geranylgeranyltransferase type-1 subunit alpha n=1 Tax=Phtheirospermum japonicum TaxID=374723 RepID=A0A830BXL5_9LAMI|nr:protein farnesyltransferase/ geranylgeranyltransferase type-1 subunit alpha [Phtheirospermum japonicum]